MEPNRMNCSRFEQMGTKEYGTIVKIIQRGRVSQRGNELENRGRKEKNYEKGL